MIWGQYADVCKRNQSHHHDLHELVTCLGNTGHHWVNGVDYLLTPGRTIFLPSSHTHYVDGTPDAPARIAFVCFDQAFLAQSGDDNLLRTILQSGQDRRYAAEMTPAQAAEALQLTERIQEELAAKRLFSEAMVASLVRQLLVLHTRALPIAPRRETAALTTTKIVRITKRISESPGADFSLDALAAREGLSRRALTGEFRRHTGMSLVEYVLDARIRLAMSHLGGSQEPISAVAETCGFRNLGHFHRVFRHLCGMTPRQYRTNFAALGPFPKVLRSSGEE